MGHAHRNQLIRVHAHVRTSARLCLCVCKCVRVHWHLHVRTYYVHVFVTHVRMRMRGGGRGAFEVDCDGPLQLRSSQRARWGASLWVIRNDSQRESEARETRTLRESGGFH